ncbi:MAG: Asp-tRNA(Asn)/Glu-tRNA(Gln) amidotransferase subunit GatB [Candidatus Omnitrophica bacterium]|nr:Asp-tRNA(Asn)/Glu-tRNA(Gln) amidotransferase subunit GatB [Candidatus Omnitrophota bacterium]
MSDFETVIGLEVHVQLKTDSKIFCSCSTAFENPPNSNICPICCGYPGVLPVFNKKALELAVRVSLALDCAINEYIYFERKNYFYPDLPKNYQISQYKQPLAENGFIELINGSKIGVERVHLEEDAGKLIHAATASLVDYNRTGIPLLEIVSRPDIRSALEAVEYLTSLKQILQYIGASDCDMEKGSLRCDANISLREKGDKNLGTKVEIKNMNSFKGIRDALLFEEKRQKKSILEGKKILQETRLWDVDNSKTIVMRSKEEAHDYRYFPEPDLLDFAVTEDLINLERSGLPELPKDKKERFIKQYCLADGDIKVLLSALWLADFFEEAVANFNQPKQIFNWLTGPFLEQVNGLDGGFKTVGLCPAKFAKIVEYFCSDKLNNLAAKKVLAKAIVSNRDIDEIIAEEGLAQMSDSDDLTEFIHLVIEEFPKPVEEYILGKETTIQFLVGQVMKRTKGKANPKIVKSLLIDALSKLK